MRATATGSRRGRRAAPIAGVAARVERLQRDRAAVDPHDLADLGAAADVEADAFAEPQEAREPGDAIVRHRDLGHDAADPDRLQEFGAPGQLGLKPIERVHALAIRRCLRSEAVAASIRDQPLEPSVLIASVMRRFGLFGTRAVTPSKARVTVDQLASFPSIGLTLEPSTKPWATPLAVKSRTGGRRLVGNDAGIVVARQLRVVVDRVEAERADLRAVLARSCRRARSPARRRSGSSRIGAPPASSTE